MAAFLADISVQVIVRLLCVWEVACSILVNCLTVNYILLDFSL
jgi:hypothetical protein